MTDVTYQRDLANGPDMPLVVNLAAKLHPAALERLLERHEELRKYFDEMGSILSEMVENDRELLVAARRAEQAASKIAPKDRVLSEIDQVSKRVRLDLTSRWSWLNTFTQAVSGFKRKIFSSQEADLHSRTLPPNPVGDIGNIPSSPSSNEPVGNTPSSNEHRLYPTTALPSSRQTMPATNACKQLTASGTNERWFEDLASALQQSPELTKDPRRFKSLLRDLLPGDDNRAKVSALRVALEESVPKLLEDDHSRGEDPEFSVVRNTRNFINVSGLDKDLAGWAVRIWGTLLGLVERDTSPAGPGSQAVGNLGTSPSGPGNQAVGNLESPGNQAVGSLGSNVPAPSVPVKLAAHSSARPSLRVLEWIPDRIVQAAQARGRSLRNQSAAVLIGVGLLAAAGAAEAATIPSLDSFKALLSGLTQTQAHGSQTQGQRQSPHVDLAAPAGTPISAPAGGILQYRDDPSGYGLYASLTEPDGTEHLLGHMQDQAGHKPGDAVQVKPGAVIGHVGSTGRSAGAHLHWGVKKPGVGWIDPLAAAQNLQHYKVKMADGNIVEAAVVPEGMGPLQAGDYLVRDASKTKWEWVSEVEFLDRADESERTDLVELSDAAKNKRSPRLEAEQGPRDENGNTLSEAIEVLAGVASFLKR